MKTAAAAAAKKCAMSFPRLADTTKKKKRGQSADGRGPLSGIRRSMDSMLTIRALEVERTIVAFSQYLPTLAAMIAGGSPPYVFNGGTNPGQLGRAGSW